MCMSLWLKRLLASKSLLILTAFLALGVAGWWGWQAATSSGLVRTEIGQIFSEVSKTVEIPALVPHPATIPGLRATPVEPTSLKIISTYSSTASFTSYRASFISEGLTEYGLLTIPTTPPPSGGYPAIVFVHGYVPPTLYKTDERYVAYVQYLASRGFVVFKIDLRGHDQSEGQAGGGYFSPGYVMDVRAAVTALQSDSRINPEKIGTWGHSMAGNVTMRAAVVDPRIKAAVIWGGAVYSYEDMQELGLNDNSYRPPSTASPGASRRQIIEEHGPITLDNPFWQSMSPLSYLADFSTPVQLHHAVNDAVVSVEYARRLAQAMEAAGKTIELFEYSSGGHDIEGAAFTQAMQRTADFYRLHL